MWLVRADVTAIHGLLLNEHGGLPGLRDEGLLESALARPQNLFAYGDPDLFQLAAAYSAGLTQNHPFNDGNKRIAFMAAYVFLGVNGCELEAAEIEAVQMVLALTTKRIQENEFAGWLRANCQPATKRTSSTRQKKSRKKR